MKIEAGKFYKLRNGCKAYVAAIPPSPDRDDTTFIGYYTLNGQGVAIGWNAEGRYTFNWGDAQRDIVEEWVDKPEVNWSLMPPWAKFVARDGDGRWYSYRQEPRQSGACKFWLVHDGQDESSTTCIPADFAPTFSGPWDESLVERP